MKQNIPIDKEIQKNLKKPSTWRRVFFMLIFAFIVGFVRMILWAVVLFQLATALITGSPNPHALRFGRILTLYLYQILLFLTFNSDEMPFPFSDLETEGELTSVSARKLKD